MKLIEFLASCFPTTVVMKARTGAHFMARKMIALDQEVTAQRQSQNNEPDAQFTEIWHRYTSRYGGAKTLFSRLAGNSLPSYLEEPLLVRLHAHCCYLVGQI